MFDEPNSTIIKRQNTWWCSFEHYSFWNIKEVTNRITTCDSMKLSQEQASGTTKFVINFSNANKRIFVCLHKPILHGLLNYIWKIVKINILVSLAFTMHGMLKLQQQQQQQQTISVSTSKWLDVNSVFNSPLFILYVTALEINISIPSSLTLPGLAGCIVWISKLVQLYFLCFQGIVNRIYLGSFLGYFPSRARLQYRYWLDLFFRNILGKILIVREN